MFPGNNDENTVVKHYLRHNVTALLVRFFPETYFTYPAMRVEVYGGKGTFTTCKLLFNNFAMREFIANELNLSLSRAAINSLSALVRMK